MSPRVRIAVTRKLPDICARRLAETFDVRWGDDGRQYDNAEIAALAEGAAGLIVTPAERVESGAINAFPPSVKVISAFSVGYEHIDVAAANARGIVVTNTPGVLTDATAEIALLLLLGAARRAVEGELMMRRRSWPGWRPTQLLGTQLSGKKLGIVGLGRIGAAVAQRAEAFGMSILYHNRRPSELAAPQWTFCPELDSMLAVCDAGSLHRPLTDPTHRLFYAARIAKMK
ncbi:MAG: D-glycerate dehydrogenase, partial [Rhodobacteraceae bacterium]|nr:D-glycerate dehydrogenase [Paracoccaceae bacterium]